MAGTLRDPLIGKSVGSYSVERLLGSGAFGKVYLGLHPTIGTKVAIKVLSNSFSEDEEVVHRFISEARAVNVIKHPNIIQIFDFGQLEDERFYCVMEFVEGEELTKIMQRKGCFPIGEALALLEQIVHGLEAAHEEGIIHRDLKPDNIMVYTTKSGPVVKILDFGIAKLLESKEATSYKTKTGQVMGTPAYMAPEQAKGDGEEIGVRCDVYSLGVILYQMLAGDLPITGNSVADLLVKLLIEPPMRMKDKVTGLPDSICEMVRVSLAKEPAERYDTVTAFLNAFKASCVGVPPETRAVPILHDTLREIDDQDGQLSSAETLAAPDLAQQSGISRKTATTTMPKGALVSDVATPEQQGSQGGTRVTAILVFLVFFAALAGGGWFIFLRGTTKKSGSADDGLKAKAKAAMKPVIEMRAPRSGSLGSGMARLKRPVVRPAPRKEMSRVEGSDLCFFMGDEKGEAAEKPAHMVCLSPYLIDTNEVTVAQYAKCVSAGKCSIPKESDDAAEQFNCNWGKPGREAHPINCVDWNQANNFCVWAKKRLPTEAEWEFAARGKSREYLYPWGAKGGDCKVAIVWDDGASKSGCGKGSTWPAGSKRAGASPYKVNDLIGNVWEWVADFYDPGYYKSVASSMVRDPKGPAKPTASRVLRGGAFNTNAVKATFRAGKVENVRMTHIGFRCALTISKNK